MVTYFNLLESLINSDFANAVSIGGVSEREYIDSIFSGIDSFAETNKDTELSRRLTEHNKRTQQIPQKMNTSIFIAFKILLHFFICFKAITVHFALKSSKIGCGIKVCGNVSNLSDNTNSILAC